MTSGKRVITVAACLVSVAASAAYAAGTPWKPGTPMYVTEDDISELLQQTYDQAYCSGIQRFGKRGEFPYEKYVVFDCSFEINRTYCSDQRYRSVKAAKRGYFTSRIVRRGDCYTS